MPVPHTGNQNASDEEVEVVVAIVAELLRPGATWVNGSGETQPLTPTDLRIVAPYNAHVNRLRERLDAGGVPVGTVDRFQGQEGPVVIYSMATSSPADAPRGMEFLYSPEPAQRRLVSRPRRRGRRGVAGRVRARVPHAAPDAARECALPVPRACH